MAYKGKYSGQQLEAVLDSVGGKQDAIDDLADIRSGASAGSTAVQPSELETMRAAVAAALASFDERLTS